MRHFSFKVDLRKVKKLKKEDTTPEPVRSAPAADDFELSLDLSTQRQDMGKWPGFQRQLESQPRVVDPAPHWADQELAQEYLRIFNVSRDKVLEAEPGFRSEGKIETHCFFGHDGSKHLVSRVVARPDDRVTELRLLPSGELIRLYYENAGGPEQSLGDLFEGGLEGLEQDHGRFARHPHYQLRYFLLQPGDGSLQEAFRGVYAYDPGQGKAVDFEELPS